jgi:hypothetical protein
MNDVFTPRANGGVRVGDVERDRAAAVLGEHFSAGRLDRAELDTRVAAAFAARTEADLEALFTDLPGGARPIELQHTSDVQPQPSAWRCSSLPLAIIPIALVLAIVAAVHGFPPFFLIPLFFWLRMGRRWRYRPGPRLR